MLLAALLHDIGKPLADLRITLFGAEAHAGTPWRAFAGAVTDTPGATHYAVEFASPTERDYDEHKRLAYSMAQGFVPQHVRLWLAEDAALMRELAAYLSGEAREGAIAGIVKRADAESVRHDLRHGPRTRFASARTVPLIERLMAALRRMLTEGGHLPLNKPGAVGWVYESDIWFVSKRMADAVRAYLIAHEQRHDDAPSIPENNERLFDTWGEYGACITNPETSGTVWTARIEMAGFSQRLTLLRFPLAKLYPEPGCYPADMEGRIVVLPRTEQAESATAHPEAAATVTNDKRDAEPADDIDTPRETATVNSAVTGDARVQDHDNAQDAFLDEDDAADRERTLHASAAQHPPQAPSAPVAPASPRTPTALLGGETKPPSKSKEAALRFFAWIQEGIAAGTIKYNVAEARIHFVAEGMLLVSPGTFRDYAAAFGDTEPAVKIGEDSKDRRGNGIQNAVKRSGLVVPSSKGNYLHRYQVLRGGAPGGLLDCFLVPEPALFFNPVPPPNPLLKRFTAEEAD